MKLGLLQGGGTPGPPPYPPFHVYVADVLSTFIVVTKETTCSFRSFY